MADDKASREAEELRRLQGIAEEKMRRASAGGTEDLVILKIDASGKPSMTHNANISEAEAVLMLAKTLLVKVLQS